MDFLLKSRGGRQVGWNGILIFCQSTFSSSESSVLWFDIEICLWRGVKAGGADPSDMARLVWCKTPEKINSHKSCKVYGNNRWHFWNGIYTKSKHKLVE